MSFETIRFSEVGQVATITLNRPDAMNSISPKMLEEMVAAIDSIRGRDDLRVLVLTGTGRAFCTGADLKSVGDTIKSGGGADAFLAGVKTMMDTIRSFPKPVIIGLNGVTVAGGLEIAMCGDIIVAADTARIGDGHLNFGVIPGAGGAAILPRLVGPVVAKYLLYSGDLLPATELAHTGLLAKVWPVDIFEAELAGLAEKVAAKSPLGLRITKELVDQGLGVSMGEALQLEIDANVAYSRSADMKEGMAAFAEKRKPVFTGK